MWKTKDFTSHLTVIINVTNDTEPKPFFTHDQCYWSRHQFPNHQDHESSLPQSGHLCTPRSGLFFFFRDCKSLVGKQLFNGTDILPRYYEQKRREVLSILYTLLIADITQNLWIVLCTIYSYTIVLMEVLFFFYKFYYYYTCKIVDVNVYFTYWEK